MSSCRSLDRLTPTHTHPTGTRAHTSPSRRQPSHPRCDRTSPEPDRSPPHFMHGDSTSSKRPVGSRIITLGQALPRRTGTTRDYGEAGFSDLQDDGFIRTIRNSCVPRVSIQPVQQSKRIPLPSTTTANNRTVLTPVSTLANTTKRRQPLHSRTTLGQTVPHDTGESPLAIPVDCGHISTAGIRRGRDHLPFASRSCDWREPWWNLADRSDLANITSSDGD